VSDPAVVRLERLSKRFKLYQTARARLLDWLQVPPGPRYREFWALRDVSFEVHQGECLGIIGPNGAGKTTLLKLLTGALHPTSGEMHLEGRVLSLLELGTGFTPELTGRENIAQSARLLGFTKATKAPNAYAQGFAEEIAAFAELGDFFDRPIKFYSSGMLVRLAFSLFSTMEPEVFLIDEALAVGDMRFASKAFGRVRGMLARGTTILFVSHDLQMVNQLCSRALWIQAGTVQMLGNPSDVTRAYQQFVVHGAAEQKSMDSPHQGDDAGVQVGGGALGTGWYPLEAYGGEIFRWAAHEAEIVISPPASVGRELQLEVQPMEGEGEGDRAVLHLTDEAGLAVAELVITGRCGIQIPVPSGRGAAQRMYLRTDEDALAAPAGDGRVLGFRAFRWRWSDQPDWQPIDRLDTWVDSGHDLDLQQELTHMRRAVARCSPAAGAPVRITRIVTRTPSGVESVRFATYEPLLADVEVLAERDTVDLVVGIQVRDAFDRMLWTTRTDWQGWHADDLPAGGSRVIRFRADRLLLGRGLYQLSVAIHSYPHEEQVFHWIDGAWRFEVVDLSDAAFKGQVDLGWRCSTPAPLEEDRELTAAGSGSDG
jgi:ABC-type polysaccharide/polyol phosphate transport system ATPase subunit